MRAWLFKGAGQPLELTELPDPIAAPGWVVLRVEAAGICHSDVTICDGPGAIWLQRKPIVLGHEIAGTVISLGDGVETLAIGDRVGVGSGPHVCHGGWALPPIAMRVPDTVVPQAIRFAQGLSDHGGFAEQVVIPAHHVVRIPEGVDFSDAAVATDAIATSYHAVRTAGNARPGEKVAIIGLGGLGLNGVQVAALAGATVYGVDIDTGTFDKAREFGAVACFDSVAALQPLKPDLIVDFAGVSGTLDAAVAAARVRGRIVLVGLGAVTVPVSLFSLIGGEVEVIGSLGYDMAELAQVYEFLAKGELKPLTEEVSFESLPDAIEKLRAGKATARLFTRPNA